MKSFSHIETLDEEAKDHNISTFYNSENLSLNNSHIILDDKGEKEFEKVDELIYDDKVFGVNIKNKYPWRHKTSRFRLHKRDKGPSKGYTTYIREVLSHPFSQWYSTMFHLHCHRFPCIFPGLAP